MKDWQKQFDVALIAFILAVKNQATPQEGTAKEAIALENSVEEEHDKLIYWISQVEADAYERGSEEQAAISAKFYQESPNFFGQVDQAYERAAKKAEWRIEAAKKGVPVTDMTIAGELMLVAEMIRDLKGGDTHDKEKST